MKKDKLLWITGLKGVAAIIVFIHHFFLFFYPAFCDGQKFKTGMNFEKNIIKTPFNIFGWGGNSAVCIFFCISGFLIAYSFFIRNKGKQNLDTLFKRYFSLMIPILLSSIVIFLILKSQIFRNEWNLNAYIQKGLSSYYNSYNKSIIDVIYDSIFGVFYFGGASTNPPLWTMKYELMYSLLLMLILYAFGNHPKRYFVYIGLIIFNMNSYFLCFILGSVICDIYYNKKEIFDLLDRKDIKILCFVFGLYFISITYLSAGEKIYSLLNLKIKWIDSVTFFHIVGSALIVLSVLLSNILKKILSLKLIVRIGELSLNIYLFHWVVVNTFSMYVAVKLMDYMKYYQASLISLILSTILIMIMSVYFEKYFNRITSFVTSKIKKSI